MLSSYDPLLYMCCNDALTSKLSPFGMCILSTFCMSEASTGQCLHLSQRMRQFLCSGALQVVLHPGS